MTIYERIKLVIKWLIGNGVASSQKEVGALMGYKSESAFSQVLNGKVPMPADFVDRLVGLSPLLSKEWVLDGKGDNSALRIPIEERIKEYIDFKGISIMDFGVTVGFSSADVTSIKKPMQPDLMKVMTQKYPDLNTEWLLTGEGKMLKNENENIENDIVVYIPLLPVSAQGGSLNDFVVSVKDSDCEKIISPIKGADFAIAVSGDSMAPEYPSGSKILIKKINEKSFIEWGRCYVLDTCNGTVIKKLVAPEEVDKEFGLDYVTCVSVNPNPIYKPFRVSTKDINGMYRVLLLLTEK